MSNSKQRNCKKRRISDSDPSFCSPLSTKRKKLSHPPLSATHKIYSNPLDMDRDDVSLLAHNDSTNSNHNNNNPSNSNVIHLSTNTSKSKTKTVHKASSKHHLKHSNQTVPPPPSHVAHSHPHSAPSLLFENDDINDVNATDIDMELMDMDTDSSHRTISTPMGFNLSHSEIIGMLMQFLDNAGYTETAQCLSNEAGVHTQSTSPLFLKQWILNGAWEKLAEFYNHFNVDSNRHNVYPFCITAQNLYYSKILISEQKYLELIYQRAKTLANEVLNKELIPLISPILSNAHKNSKSNRNKGNNHHSNKNRKHNRNESDIQLLQQLTSSHQRPASHIDASSSSSSSSSLMLDSGGNSIYPMWRWHKLCNLLYCADIEYELNALNWHNIKDARHQLYNELICKLTPLTTLPSNDTLLNIYDQYIKCQLLQSAHFNLRSNNISLMNQSHSAPPRYLPASSNDNECQQDSQIPSDTYYTLKGHNDEITHLSFSADGEWLISSSSDRRTLIWDFSNVFMSQPPLSPHNNRTQCISIICDILHYQSVTFSSLSHNKQYLITITEYQPKLDDFKHNKDLKNHLRRESDRYSYPKKPLYKYEYMDQCHKMYYDGNTNSTDIGNDGHHQHKKQQHGQHAQDDRLMMQTERGCNIYVWKLIQCDNGRLDYVLYQQYHHYRVEASVVWCPDSEHYFITAHQCDIDLYNLATNEIICTLPCNGNLFTDLKLSYHGYRLCVTMNARDVRVYITDFNKYYNSLERYFKKYGKYHKRKKHKMQPAHIPPTPSFVPWLNFTHKNYINLFQNNISNYITKVLCNKQQHDIMYEWNNTYNDLLSISKQQQQQQQQLNTINEEESNLSDSSSIGSSSSSSPSVYSSSDSDHQYPPTNNIVISKYNANQSMLSETESLESIDDKLWMQYETQLEYDKKSNGQLKHDMIVSTAISYGGEHEYLLIMVHEFNINQDIRVPHPIILMIDLRNINFNINYNNSDIQNNNKNLLNIKFFFGFQQTRFKLQCGFGGFQLPPLSTKSQIYQQSRYLYNKRLRDDKSQKQMRSKRAQQQHLKQKLNASLPTYTNGHSAVHHKKRQNRDTSSSQRTHPASSGVFPSQQNTSQQTNVYTSYALNNHELRNLRIPFVQSLQNEELSNLQQHIHQRVDQQFQTMDVHKKKSSKSSSSKRRAPHHHQPHQHDTELKNDDAVAIDVVVDEEHDLDDDDNKESLPPSVMMEECIKLSLKYPELLPSRILQDTGCSIDEPIREISKFEPVVRSLYASLPMSSLQRVFKFMQSKVDGLQKKQIQAQQLKLKRGGKIGKNEINNFDKYYADYLASHRITVHQKQSRLSTKRRLLQKEISNAFKYCDKSKLTENGNNKNNANNNNHRNGMFDYEQLDSSSSTAISSGSLNSLSHSLNHKYLLSPTSDNYMSSISSTTLTPSIMNNSQYIFDHTRYNPKNVKTKCFQLKEKRDKLTKLGAKHGTNNRGQIEDEDNNGRSHYLFQKYIRSQIVDDDSDLNYFSNHIDQLLRKQLFYAQSEQAGMTDAERTHLAMEMKYFLWHKHLKQQHFNRMRQEHYYKISKKKKKKKLKKLQAMNVESKLKYAIKKKKKIEKRSKSKFGSNYSKFLEPHHTKKKSKMKRRHKLDKSRRSNEDIQITPKPSSADKKANHEDKDKDDEDGHHRGTDKGKESNGHQNDDNNQHDDEKKTEHHQEKKKRHAYSDDDDDEIDSELSSNNDSDLDEYVAVKNSQFLGDELNEMNVDMLAEYDKNQSTHKLNLNEISNISELINNRVCNRNDIDSLIVNVNQQKIQDRKNTLVQNDYIENDFFGGHHFVISGSEDGNVCIWNRITQKIVKLQGHEKSVNCVAWNPVDSFVLVSGSDDCSIRVWGPNPKDNHFKY